MDMPLSHDTSTVTGSTRNTTGTPDVEAYRWMTSDWKDMNSSTSHGDETASRAPFPVHAHR
jgi:hypothetical protein